MNPAPIWSRRQLFQSIGAIATAHAAGLLRCNVLFGEEGSDEGYRVSIPSMGSLIELRWVNHRLSDAESVLRDATALADAWVDVLSDYQQDSQCNQLCRDADAGDWVTPSPELWRMLEQCDHWYRISEGAFDASLGTITRLRRSRRDVSEDAWRSARERSGWNHLELDTTNRRLRVHRPGIRLDFGAIGKGFVVDRLGEMLREQGITAFLINASGNMLCGDAPRAEPKTEISQGWPVTIGMLGHPDREMKRLRLTNRGIATSGDQFQKYRNGGTTYDETEQRERTTSHILDPELRRGLEESNMATVITASASDADALATACCVHLQRGDLSSWLARIEGAIAPAEFILQSARDRDIALTSAYCDW